jgi:hypothetical protein
LGVFIMVIKFAPRFIRINFVLIGIDPALSTMWTVFAAYNYAFVGQSPYDPLRLPDA